MTWPPSRIPNRPSTRITSAISPAPAIFHLNSASTGTATLPLGIDLREIQLTSVGWSLFFVVQAAYCTAYTHIVAASPWAARDMLGWALREWGIWLLLTPLVFRVARRHEAWLSGNLYRCAALAGCVLAISLPARLGIEAVVGDRDTFAAFLVLLPKHAAAITAILAVWHHFLRRAPETLEDEPRQTGTPKQVNGRTPESVDTLLVSKGRDECLIRTDQIEHVSTSGNYLEIGCQGQLYLIRGTMKQIESLLPPRIFLRVHRCHLVNIDGIDRITWRRSGNGILRLKSGRTVNVSKTYKGELQSRGDIRQHKAVANETRL